MHCASRAGHASLRALTYGDGTSDGYSQYDAGDNLQRITQTFAGGSEVSFSYSWFANHQRQATGVDNSAFQYAPPSPQTVSYNPADVNNGYTMSNVGTDSTSYTYDCNRNLTFDGRNTLAYDVENRLVQAQNAVWGTSTYLYDPLGHRKQKQVGDVVTQFVLVGGQEIADYNGAGAGTPWMLTVRGAGGQPVAAVTPATSSFAESVAFYHQDILGSTTASTQAGTAGPAEVYAYSDYGQPSGGSFLPYRFAGYRYDQETGLYFVQARYYSPVIGRFLQPDPVGVSGGRNLYAYALNDPANLIDQNGLTADSPDNAWEQVWHEGDPLYKGAVMSRNNVAGEEMVYGADVCNCTPAPVSTNAFSSMANQLDTLGQKIDADLAYANSINTPNGPQSLGQAENQLSMGVSISGSAIPFTNFTSGGNGTWGYNQQSFGATTNNYTYSGPGLGLNLGASVQSNWAYGSGSWEGPFHSINISAGPLAGSIYWTPGSGGWVGVSFGVGVGLPGGSYEETNYTKR